MDLRAYTHTPSISSNREANSNYSALNVSKTDIQGSCKEVNFVPKLPRGGCNWPCALSWLPFLPLCKSNYRIHILRTCTLLLKKTYRDAVIILIVLSNSSGYTSNALKSCWTILQKILISNKMFNLTHFIYSASRYMLLCRCLMELIANYSFLIFLQISGT